MYVEIDEERNTVTLPLPEEGFSGFIDNSLNGINNAHDIRKGVKGFDKDGNLIEGVLEVGSGQEIIDELTEEVEELQAEVNRMGNLQEKTVTSNGVVTPDEGYYALSKVTVMAGSSDDYLSMYYQVTYLRNNMTSYTNNTVSSIYMPAFKNCSNLRTVSMENVETIGYQVFDGCYNLSSVYFPNLKTLGNCFGYYCPNLNYLSLPACTSCYMPCYVEYANLPVCTTLDGGGNNIQHLVLSSVSSVTRLTSHGMDYLISVFVPESLVNDFKTATNWVYYSSKIFACPSNYNELAKVTYGSRGTEFSASETLVSAGTTVSVTFTDDCDGCVWGTPEVNIYGDGELVVFALDTAYVKVNGDCYIVPNRVMPE